MSAPIGPGDLIECIDARPSSYAWDPGYLVLGRVYTVDRAACVLDGPGVTLTAPETKEWDITGAEGFWRLDRFRPVRRPNIEILKSLLQPSPERATEDA